MILDPEQDNTRIGFVRKTLYDYLPSAPTTEFSMVKPAAGKVAKFDSFCKYGDFQKNRL